VVGEYGDKVVKLPGQLVSLSEVQAAESDFVDARHDPPLEKFVEAQVEECQPQAADQVLRPACRRAGPAGRQPARSNPSHQ
jgi:hypothetical protein